MPQTGLAALNETGEKFPSIQTMDINPLVYGIFSVKFAFFVRIDGFPPTIELLACPYSLFQMLLAFMSCIKLVFFMSVTCLVRYSHFLASLCSILCMSILLTPF